MENLALSKRTNPEIFIKKSNYSQTTFLIKKKKKKHIVVLGQDTHVILF